MLMLESLLKAQNSVNSLLLDEGLQIAAETTLELNPSFSTYEVIKTIFIFKIEYLQNFEFG
jgi:hypothetical protein